jgi:hypothetical protein
LQEVQDEEAQEEKNQKYAGRSVFKDDGSSSSSIRSGLGPNGIMREQSDVKKSEIEKNRGIRNMISNSHQYFYIP